MIELQKQDLKTDKRPYNFKKRSCPLSSAGAPKVDYKNINLLKINRKGNEESEGNNTKPPQSPRFPHFLLLMGCSSGLVILLIKIWIYKD